MAPWCLAKGLGMVMETECQLPPGIMAITVFISN